MNPPTIKSTLEIYLAQGVKIASGDRVYIYGGMKFTGNVTNPGYIVFKCKQCQDNWHVGLDNFNGNISDPYGGHTIPSVLSEWVKKHRHVCQKFDGGLKQGQCKKCDWPYGAHEESWNKALITDYSNLKTTVPGAKQIDLDQLNELLASNRIKRDIVIAAAKDLETPKTDKFKMPEFKGRKFRDE